MNAITNVSEFEQRLAQALHQLGYSEVQPVESPGGGPRTLRATRETLLGRDVVHVVLAPWDVEAVARGQVEEIVGRLEAAPRDRIVVVSRHRFEHEAREFARGAGITLLGGPQVTTLLQRAASGGSPTEALAAASAAPTSPAPAVAAPAVPTPPAMSEKERKARAGRRTVAPPRRRAPQSDRFVAAVFLLLTLVAAVGTTVAILSLSPGMRVSNSESARAIRETINVVPAASGGSVVTVAGAAEPGTDLALYRNGAFYERTRSSADGTFTFEFIPLADGTNQLVIYRVLDENQRGNQLWSRRVRSPFAPPP